MKKLPIIRHIRAIYLTWRVYRWAEQCTKLGLGTGIPNESDRVMLRLIWEGKA